MPSRLKRTRLILLRSVSRQTFDTGLNLPAHFFLCSLILVCAFFLSFFSSFFLSFCCCCCRFVIVVAAFFIFYSSSSHKQGKHTIIFSLQ